MLGALAICVIALAAYVLTTNTVKDRTAQLAATEAQAAETTQRVAQLKPYVDFQSMAETRIQTVRDLASSRFDWEQALRDISRALPANVTLETLNGSISSQSGAGSAVRSAISAPAIELKGCTTGQLSVATLMSRLRNVDGVTRVSLGKSIKADEAATGDNAAAAVTTAPGERPLCGAVRAPTFELVVFFERSEVPETVQEITVQPQAATAAADSTGTATASPETSGTAQDPATATPASTPQGTATP